MNICIICRKEKENFNDEHVIPDSIQGYYHIYSVCVECNSELGGKIDSVLINHKFIEFQRNLLKIKGKSGTIPNPFTGTHFLKDEPEQKVLLELSDDEFIPRLLPQIPDLKNEPLIENFTITLDKRNEKDLDKILDKLITRNGINKSKISSTIKYSKTQPIIQIKLRIDLHEFKAGMLKIAYEFAVDSLPNYFDDDLAKVISEILYKADFENLTKKVKFLGSGFDKTLLKPFEHLIELENNNHYLILISSSLGLICFVNLFNNLSIGIILSEKTNYLKNDFIVGKNDLAKHTFEKLNLNQVFNKTYSNTVFRFKYWLAEQKDVDELFEMEKNTQFGFFYEDGKIAFYNNKGMKVYEDMETKLLTLTKLPKGDTQNKIITEYILSDTDDLYIKLLPSMKLYKVICVSQENQRIGKI
jgi:hypothetical protein